MKLDSPQALEARLRRIGAERYHNNHPFHALMRDGALDRGQVQAWALNRYYYQSRIPIKDSALMSRIVDADLRREWSQRVVDHDGTREGQGGVAKWLHLCERLGLDRKRVLAEDGVLPATRFAVDAYVHFVRERPLLEAIASSLTELFAPSIIGERTSAMLARYDFIDEDTLTYFTARLTQAPRDADFALDYVKRHATTPELRETVCQALVFKTDVLWAQLDALHFAYVSPRIPRPERSCPARSNRPDRRVPAARAVPTGGAGKRPRPSFSRRHLRRRPPAFAGMPRRRYEPEPAGRRSGTSLRPCPPGRPDRPDPQDPVGKGHVCRKVVHRAPPPRGPHRRPLH